MMLSLSLPTSGVIWGSSFSVASKKIASTTALKMGSVGVIWAAESENGIDFKL